MACQGCGNNSDKKLCCPTCVELGRKSFFCSQDCFTKNWKSHNQLHNLLKKQKALDQQAAAASALESGDAPASAIGAAADGVGALPTTSTPSTPSTTMSAPSSSSAPQMSDRAARAFAPLPGGDALLSHLNSQVAPAAAAAAAGFVNKAQGLAKDGAAAGIGDMVGRFSGWFGPGEQARGREAGSSNVRARGASRDRDGRSGLPPGRPRAGSRGDKADKPPPAKASLAKTGLRALGALAFVAAGSYYIGFVAMRSEPRVDPVLVDLSGVEPVAATQLPPGGIVIEAQADPLSSAELRGLQSELASLRGTLERHDKMLRYIMDRYVEKDSPLLASTKDGLLPEAFEPPKEEAAKASDGDTAVLREEAQVFVLPTNSSEAVVEPEKEPAPLLPKNRRRGGLGMGAMDEPGQETQAQAWGAEPDLDVGAIEFESNNEGIDAELPAPKEPLTPGRDSGQGSLGLAP